MPCSWLFDPLSHGSAHIQPPCTQMTKTCMHWLVIGHSHSVTSTLLPVVAVCTHTSSGADMALRSRSVTNACAPYSLLTCSVVQSRYSLIGACLCEPWYCLCYCANLVLMLAGKHLVVTVDTALAVDTTCYLLDGMCCYCASILSQAES